MKYCLGTVQFGMDYGIQKNGRPIKNQVFDMLDYAINNGIKTFDTASAYGDAETIIGDYICNNPQKGNRLKIVSKLSPDALSNCDRLEWRGIIARSIEESLERLRIDKLDAYLFHNADYIYDEKAVEALCFAKEQGLVERIGVSIYNPKEALKALEYEEIGVIQIPYNVFDQRLDRCGFFEKSESANVEIFARSSLLQGLALMNPNNLPNKVKFAKGYLKAFLDICDRYGCSPLKAAVGYVNSKSEIDYIVFGVDNLEHLEEYLSIRDWIMPQAMIGEIREGFKIVDSKLVNPSLW